MPNTCETSTDLSEAVSPADVAMILRNAARVYHESASELESAWQDKGAGEPWAQIACQLETLAEKIEVDY